MGSEPVVLDISSDEEDAAFDDLGKSPFEFGSSFDWLSKMLELDDEPWGSDNAVVVDDVSCSSAVQKSCSTQLGVARHVSLDDSDDDCKVLDGDPDKPVEVVQNAGNGSDELLIVGEKGQLACRDFPHSRHSCAIFPFATTSHDKFCKLCHCFVCDIPAPCAYWGTGSSTDDHCHSSDKNVKWREKRKALRGGNNATQSSRRPSSMRLTGIRASSCHLPRRIAPSLIYDSCQSVPSQNPAAVASRPCPVQSSIPVPIVSASISGKNSNYTPYAIDRHSTTSFSTPSQRCYRQPGILHSNQRGIQPVIRSPQFSGAGSILLDGRSPSPQIISTHVRGRMAGAEFTNLPPKRPRTSTAHLVYSRKLQRTSHLPAQSVDENFKKWQDVLLGRDTIPDMGLQQHRFNPQPEVYAEHCTQSISDSLVGYFMCSAPPTSRADSLTSGRFNASSVNATAPSPMASCLSNVQSSCPYAVPGSNPLSGDITVEDRS